jgi:hypothetical protein
MVPIFNWWTEIALNFEVFALFADSPLFPTASYLMLTAMITCYSTS